MKIYTLTPLGYRASHSTRDTETDEWKVVHYLARVHMASNDKIQSDLGVSPSTLAKLSRKNIIEEQTGA